MIGKFPPSSGDVDKAGHAQGRVEGKPRKRLSRAFELALQRVARKNQRLTQIAEKVAQRIAHRVGQHRTVGLGDRHQHVAIDHLVEVEDLAVDIFERVVEILCLGGFGPQVLCTIMAFRDSGGRSLGLVYLYKRGTFYPFAPLAGKQRDNALELQIRGVLGSDLKVEPDLGRWMPIWGAPGL